MSLTGNNIELDEDYILSEMKDRFGWGDLGGQMLEEFQDSKHYSGTLDNEIYIKEFHNYLYGISIGDFEEEE